MVGNGGVSRLLDLPANAVINDLDGQLISSWTFEGPGLSKLSLDYRNLIDNFDYTAKNHVFYFDPPYLMSKRKSSRKLYKHEWGLNDHVDFLHHTRMIRSKVLISGYASDLYDEVLLNWFRYTFKSMTRQGLVEEVVWCNFPRPEILQDPQYLGNNKSERECIKRKRLRLIAKLERTPPPLRAAMLSDIFKKFS